MGRELIVLITLIAYAVTLLAIGLWASRRTQSTDDFFIGGRRLGPVVAAISASASSSSAWTLLGVSGAAFVWGLPALWLFPATLMGFIINWFWVAPRLRPLADELGAVTLPDILARGAAGKSRQMILRSTAVVIVVSFLFYVASQFQAAGGAFAETFGMTRGAAIVSGGLVVL
ncbi:MAG: sodium/proline symporter, partial [Myxococcota bacterium]